MALANYTDLINAINGSGAWLHRSDLLTIAPDWITLAEVAINYGDIEVLLVEGLRTGSQETIGTLSTVSGMQTVALPSTFLEMRKVYLTYGGVRIELPQAPISPMRMTETSNALSLPRAYSVVGASLYLTPIPDAVYTITIDYYAKVGPLAGATPTNWLMTAAPNVYLSGAILAGSPWLGANFNPAPWAQMFKAGMGQIARADVKARSRLTTMRSDPAYLRQAPFNIMTGDTI